jgi:hypothetical protein
VLCVLLRAYQIKRLCVHAISRTNKEQIPEREHVRVKDLRRECHILNTTGWYSELLPKPLRW